MTVQPGSPRWNELVQQGIIRDGSRNWFLGDAALEIAPKGEQGVSNGAEGNLRQYADEIGVEYSSLRLYRDVAWSWPNTNRVVATAWKVHQQLMGRQELIQPGMTVTQAAVALGQKNVGRTGPQAPIEARVEATKNYLANPEVARQVMADPEVARQIQAAAPPSPPPYMPPVVHYPSNPVPPTRPLPPSPITPRTEPAVPPQPYKQAEPDLAAIADQEQSRRLLDDRADIAAIISTYQRVYNRGSELADTSRPVLADDLDRAAKWHEAVVQLITGATLDSELAQFLSGEWQ